MSRGWQKAAKEASDKAARASRARRGRRNRVLAISAVIAIPIIIVIAIAVTRPQSTEASKANNVETFPDQGQAHVAAGAPTPSYNSDPPTSGPHSDTSAPCGIYRSAIPSVVQVHDLEHGVVIIQYTPDISSADRDALEAFGRKVDSHIIVAPRTGMTEPIVLTAWTKRLGLQTADEAAIGAFYDQYAQRGPELGVPCPNDVDEAT